MGNTSLQTQYDSHYMANRISRAVGHMKLVKSMVESGADCAEILIQIAAVRGQLDSICAKLLSQYAGACAEEYRRTGDPRLVEQLQTDLGRSIKK